MMQRINLIPNQRQLARQKRVRLRYWLGAVAGYAALAVVACVVYRAASSPVDFAALSDQYSELEVELTAAKQQREALIPELREQQLLLAAGRSIADQPDWSLMLTYLADEVLGDSVVLSDCSLKPAQDHSGDGSLSDTPLTFTLSGYAKTTPDVSRFVLRLEQMGLFDKVTLARTDREPFLAGTAIVFEIQCDLLPGGGASHE